MIEQNEYDTLIIMTNKTDNLQYTVSCHYIDLYRFKTKTSVSIASIDLIIYLALNVSKNMLYDLCSRPDQIHSEHIIDVIQTLASLNDNERISYIMKNIDYDVYNEVDIYF